MKFYIPIALLLGIIACKKDPAYLKLKYASIDKTRTYRKVRVPVELRDILLNKKKTEKKEGELSAPQKLMVAQSEFEKLPMRVYLYEKTEGVLQNRNVELDYKSGGGELDLSEFINPSRRGSFYFVADAHIEGEGDLDVYFLSNAKLRKVGDESVGSGCEVFFKITDSFLSAIEHEGLKVNTSDRRHVSALAGMYFFIFKRPKGLPAIGYLDVLDSTAHDLLCR